MLGFFSVKKSPSIKIDMSIWILVGRIEEKPFDNRKNSTENKAEICTFRVKQHSKE